MGFTQASQLWKLLLGLNRRRMLIAYELGLGVEQATPEYSYAEIATLTVLRSGALHGTALSRAIGLEQSWTSRVLSRLKSQKCITLTRKEGKKSLFELTRKGHQALQRSEIYFQKIAQRLAAPLTQAQLRELTRFCHRLADLLGVKKSAPENSLELDFEEALDRLARYFAIYGSRMSAGNLSLMQWQVIDILSDCQEMAQQEIENRVAYDQSAISKLLRTWESTGLVKKLSGASDARHRVLALSQAGRELFASSVKQVSAPLSDALKEIGERERASALRLLTFINAPLTEEPPDRGSRELIVARKIEVKELRTVGRGLLLPQQLSPKNGYSGAFRQGKLLGIGILRTTRGKSLQYIYPALLTEEDERAAARLLRNELLLDPKR